MTQSDALTILKSGANVFLTGEPGSGKSHTVNEYVAYLKSHGIEPAITASTGIAATHIHGMTIHAWSGIGILNSLSPEDLDRIATREYLVKRIQPAKVLIIDEISMLSAHTLDMVEAVLREVRQTPEAFGGLQIILVGDFFQLPPITRNNLPQPSQDMFYSDEPQGIFAFTGSAWKRAKPVVCYLTEQHRQDDPEYLAVLSAIRTNELKEKHHAHIASRKVSATKLPKGITKLFSHNADVDRINAGELEKLPGKVMKFRMSSKGKDSLVEGLMRGCLSPEVLELKEGAAVMFTKNSPQGRFVNGTLGVVSGWGADGMPIVKTKDNLRITAEPMEWQLEEQGKVRASISQLPLRLAYAMTVHKSQGMSMDAAIMDLSKAFEYGQGYVALSRVRRLSGVYLTGLNQRALEVHPEILEKDRDFRAASDAARDAFASMPEAEVTDMQKKFVKAMGGAFIEVGSKQEAEGRKKNTKTAGLPGRLAETLQTVRDAKSLKEAVKARGLVASTIVKHLEELSEIGKLVRADFAHLIPLDIADEIHEALAATQGDKLSPVFHALHGRHSFEAIRLVRLMKQ